MSRIVGSVVSRVVRCVDVDGVVRQIDVNDALDRVDVNHLLDKVDVNRHLQRVDVDALLERIDLDRFIEKSNIGAIVARSSSGIFGHVADGLRAQVALWDQSVQRFGRCACCTKQRTLPPRPGGKSRRTQKAQEGSYPLGTSQLAVELQGRYAGIFPRFLAWFCDEVIILIIFTLALILLEVVVKMAVKKIDFDPRSWQYVPIAYAVWKLIYTASSLAFTGRTIGMTLFGLLVVTTKGAKIGLIRAVFRTTLSLLSFVTVLGAILGWVRRDGRQLHDLLVCTGVVFSWDARLAMRRDEAMLEEGAIYQEEVFSNEVRTL